MQNKIIDITNKNFQDNFFNKKIPNSIFDISLIEGEISYGPCIRKIFFKETNFTKSDFNLYNTEKLLTKISALNRVIKKYKQFSGIKFLDKNELELRSIHTTIEANDFLIGNKEIFLFNIIENISEFNNLNDVPLIKHFPTIIACLTSYPNMEINIVYKSLYGNSEKLFNIKIVQGILLINDNLIEFQIDESVADIKTTMDLIKKSIQCKEFPPVIRTDQCNWCYWKEICKYL